VIIKKIFTERVDVRAEPKVDALNPNYKKSGGNAQIFNEKVEFDAAPKIDVYNHDYKKQGGNIKVKKRNIRFALLFVQIKNILIQHELIFYFTKISSGYLSISQIISKLFFSFLYLKRNLKYQ
jgi:hypothetical protein